MLGLGCFCVLCFILGFFCKGLTYFLIIMCMYVNLPRKAVPRMAYIVSGGTLHTQSLTFCEVQVTYCFYTTVL